MEKEFVPYELAVKLKALGFNEPCFGYYYTLNGKDWKFAEKTEYWKLDDEINIGGKFTLLAPLYQQAFRWFRKKYKLSGLIEIGTQEYSFFIFNENKDSREVSSNINGSYEETELECVKKLIEIIS